MSAGSQEALSFSVIRYRKKFSSQNWEYHGRNRSRSPISRETRM